MKKGFIYKITAPSNQVYIGQTINIKRRFSDYRAGRLHKNQKLINSFEKFGMENHLFEVIDECWIGYKRNIINIRETFWIHEFNSVKNGLNCDDGGNGMINLMDSEEIIEKIRQKKLGTTHSFETKQKMSEQRSGEKNAFFGKKHSLETKQKITQAKQKTILIDDIEYISVKEASKILNISIGLIYQRINSKNYNYKYK